VKKIEFKDIKNIAEYEKTRDEFRHHLIQIKKNRRIQVGDLLSFLFENRETVLFQIQEMMRAERIVEDAKIQDEIDVYNALIPDKGELSATMFIEINEKDKIKEELDRMMGIDQEGTVYFKIGEQENVPGFFEAGHSKEDKISAVHYVRFRFTPDQIEKFKNEQEEIFLVVDHPNYKQRKAVPLEVRRELVKDLLED
jgi:hypothetical protein